MRSGTARKMKGRVKEAAGALADDDRLRTEGRFDQLVGKVRNAAEAVVETVADSLSRRLNGKRVVKKRRSS